MSDIAKIDKNFAVQNQIVKDDMCFINIDANPNFKIYGVFKENNKYRRIPEALAQKVNKGVYALHAHTAGGRVRFITDSPYVAIHAVLDNPHRMSHFALTGSMGFDLYVGTTYTKTFVPPFEKDNEYDGIMNFPDETLREITINFPLYSGVKELYVGVKAGCAIREPKPYKNTKPIVYYGSSITQGGCAARPGTCYEAIISARLNYDYINLGFSGSAKAEDVIADYISALDMHAFVYDYDYNTHSVDYLAETHEKMFLKVRKAHPDMPIIIMSAPKYILSAEFQKRRDIIEQTYLNAVNSGDKNVYFLDGKKLTAICKNDGTVDGAHPTDFGFASMAEAICEVMIKNNI